MRQRKTIDTFELHVNYGQGWEHELTEFSWVAACEQKTSYRDNCPEYPTKIVNRREPLASYNAEGLASIKREIDAANERARVRRAARQAAKAATA